MMSTWQPNTRVTVSSARRTASPERARLVDTVPVLLEMNSAVCGRPPSTHVSDASESAHANPRDTAHARQGRPTCTSSPFRQRNPLSVTE
eukprot:2173-Rhodomonas_salina.8